MKFKVNVNRTEYGFYEVEAENKEEALQKAEAGEYIDYFCNKSEEDFVGVEE